MIGLFFDSTFEVMRSFITCIILFVASFSAFSQESNPNYELLWEVSNGSGKPSYVFGSLHSNDRRLFNLPDSLYYALDNSDMIVLETDVFSIFETIDTRFGEPIMEFDNEGKPYTTSNHATLTSYGDEDGMPQFLDAYFQQYCYNSKKKFESLETVEFQMSLVDNIDIIPTNIDLHYYESFVTTKEDMIDLYLEGNIYKLNDFVESGLSLYQDLYETLIVARNMDMTDKIDSLIQQNTLFCAIGAGHLAGSTGVLNLLRSKGYKVRKVTATYSEDSIDSKKNVKSAREYEFKDTLTGLSITFPGKPMPVIDDFSSFIEKWTYSDLGQGNTYQVEIFEIGSLISWEDIAAEYIPSPAESDYEKIKLPNGGEAVQGLGQEYWDETMIWIRVLKMQDHIVVLKASGGNKFMNSPRPFRFFDQVKLDKLKNG